MSYEYHGYDFVPEKQPNNKSRKTISECDWFLLLEDMTYEKYVDIRASWLTKMSERSYHHLSGVVWKMNLILEAEYGDICTVVQCDIMILGDYIFIPYLDLIMKNPTIDAIDSVMEMYKL